MIAFVAEPVVGATAGCVAAPKGYFKAGKEVCDRYGILLIFDKVMCGMGRNRTYFAFEQEDVAPDVVTIGKGLGAGFMPVAGIVVAKRIIDVLRDHSGSFNHGRTYQAHAVSCATALAVQKIVVREKLVDRCRVLGTKLQAMLQEKLGDLRHVGDIRGRGLFFAVQFVKDKADKSTFDPSIHFGLRMQAKAFDLGLAVYPGAGTVDGTRGDHIMLAPAYITTVEELVLMVDILKEAYLEEEKYSDAHGLSSI